MSPRQCHLTHLLLHAFCEVTNTEKRNAGIPTVAVYSEADQHAAHVRMAQQAFCIGAPPAKESYLRKDRVLEV